MSLRPTFSELAKMAKGKLYLHSEDDVIRNISIDSRTLHSVDNTCFFAITGERKSGSDYIGDTFKRGVRFFVTDQNIDQAKYPRANFTKVGDTIKALQLIVSKYRKQFSIPVIAVTGSNGKTIVKEWLFQLLSVDNNIVRNPRSYNSQVGVPISVWNMNQDNNLGIFEAGISEPQEMEVLEGIIQPTIGILTNIGDAHGENFESLNQKLSEKLLLFKNVETIISSNQTEIVDQIKLKYPTKKHLTWGNEKADLIVKSVCSNKVSLVWQDEVFECELPFTDEASINNCITCILTLLYLDYGFETIQNRISLLSNIGMRLELKEGINNCSIINDSYNSDFSSISIALDFLNQQNQHANKTLILSDILQSGLSDEELYPKIAQLIDQKKVTRLIGIGKEIQKFNKYFTKKATFYSSTENFLRKIPNFKNETILIKGAREFHFEDINLALQDKQHETVLEINLNALINNYNYFKSLLKPTTKIMVMVKAYSYGSGSFEIANALQYNQVDYLAVAYADEGVELRKSGISLPIMVMNPEENSFDTLIEHNLEPEVYCNRILNAFEEYLTSKQIENFPIHLKIDTGMNRLGFHPNELDSVTFKINNSPSFKVVSAFTHLVGSDEPEHDEFTKRQIDKFDTSSSFLESELGYPFITHILNSNGIARFNNNQLDMVRLGIGIYGIIEAEEHQQKLETVYTLQTTISQIKHINKGETVGYNRKGMPGKDIIIATLPIGYADGINRKLGNGNCSFIVNGIACQTIGNICMDMCMIDISDVTAQEGDKVEIFGNQQNIRVLSDALETITYEVLTGISKRVKRVYYQE